MKAIAVAATHTAHPEMANAKLILFGHSAAGSFVVTFASRYPDRVLGFIRYHSVPLATPIDTSKLAQIPALTIVGARDAQVGVADSRTLWQAMRTHQAPWAYVSHVAQPHFSVDGLIEAGSLMRGWIEGIIQRSSRERQPAADAAWLVDDTSGETAPVASFVGGRDQASWLPSAATAIALKRLAGVCKAAPLAVATEILGPSARLVSETINNCRYSSDSLTKRDLVLAVVEMNSAADALAQARPNPERSGIAVSSVGEAASYSAFPLRQQQCSSLNAARLTFVATVSVCGPAVRSIADTSALNLIARRLLGAR